MKLRLQLASLLPATAKADPADVFGKSAFGTTMREMMATLSSGKSSPAGISQASLVMQAQLKKNSGDVNTAEASAVCADEGGQMHVAPRTLFEGQNKTLQGPTVTEPPAAQMAQGTDEKPAEQIPMLPQQPQLIADRGEQPRQSPAGTEPHLSPVGKDEFSRTRHMAAGKRGQRKLILLSMVLHITCRSHSRFLSTCRWFRRLFPFPFLWPFRNQADRSRQL